MVLQKTDGCGNIFNDAGKAGVFLICYHRFGIFSGTGELNIFQDDEFVRS